MKKRVKFLLLMWLCQISISGSHKIEFAEKLPVPITWLCLVNVQISGTSQGTATDTDGKYILNAPSDASLVFSYINLTNIVTVSNNGENGGFSMSLCNTDNKGIVSNSKFNRKTVNIGFTQNISKRLTASCNINYKKEKKYKSTAN